MTRAASIDRLGDSPATAQLRAQHRETRHRVLSLRARLREADPERQARAIEAMQQALDVAEQQLAVLDAQLLAGKVVEVEQPMPTDQQARDQLRQRLQHLDMVVQRHAPPSCEAAARRLHNAIHLELRRLDGVNIGTVPELRRARRQS